MSMIDFESRSDDVYPAPPEMQFLKTGGAIEYITNETSGEKEIIVSPYFQGLYMNVHQQPVTN